MQNPLSIDISKFIYHIFQKFNPLRAQKPRHSVQTPPFIINKTKGERKNNLSFIKGSRRR